MNYEQFLTRENKTMEDWQEWLAGSMQIIVEMAKEEGRKEAKLENID